MAELNPEQRAVVDALIRDVAATIGSNSETQFRADLLTQAQSALETDVALTVNGFAQVLVDEIQQRMHDEFVDVTWPRCPHHPNQPVWFVNGAWRCTQNGVNVARFGELNAMDQERG